MQNENKESIKPKFNTFPGEKLIFARRKHWSTFGIPLIISLTLAIIIFALTVSVLSLIPTLWPFILLGFGLFLLFLITNNLKAITDWYFSLYVVTDRKISEISYKPLSSRQVNEIMLDQVRCTEIDTRVEGIINEFMDIGDVIITFDRPTHQEEFLFSNISNPKQLETYLHRTLVKNNNPTYYSNINSEQETDFYTRDKQNNNKWRYAEEIQNNNSEETGGEIKWN